MQTNKLFILLFIIGFPFEGHTQAPQRFSFQAVVRHPDTSLITYKQISVRLSILKGDINGTVVYSETHSPRTNGLGLFTLEVGGGTVQSGDFSSIEWGGDSYFLKREIDPTGGTNYTISGTSQMLSVPYALNSLKSSSFDGFYTFHLNDYKGELVKFILNSTDDSYTVPEGYFFTFLTTTQSIDCKLIINDTLLIPSNWPRNTILESGSKITKYSSSDPCQIRGLLKPNSSQRFNYNVFGLKTNQIFEVPDNQIFILNYSPEALETDNNRLNYSYDNAIFYPNEKLKFSGITLQSFSSEQKYFFSGWLIDN